ncbi:hypothetical protein LIT32_12255 [Bacillus sp. CMF21]|nr:hypothetical protein LIT32_12255 [Bacillus sp. CMF21]
MKYKKFYSLIVFIIGKEKLKEHLLSTHYPEYRAKEIAKEINDKLGINKSHALGIGKFANEIGIKKMKNAKGDLLYGRFQKISISNGNEVLHFLYNEEGKEFLIDKWLENNNFTKMSFAKRE